MPDLIETIECNTLDEFWQTISPIGRRICEPNSSFLFRGQPDSRWALVPRVYRSSEIGKYKRGMMTVLRDHPGQVFFEWFLLNSFLCYCDFAGLAVPGDSMEFRSYFAMHNIMHLHSIRDQDWPQERVLQLMALAQHHGLPTRLLDWSANPFVAAYFAVAPVIASEQNARDGRIALYALDIGGRGIADYDLKVVRVPGSTSPNVAVQRGCFVLVGNAGYRGEEFARDVSLESRLLTNDRSRSENAILLKVTLPQVLAPQLLSRCEQFGVSAASVFPGYDGTARAVLEDILATPNT